MDKKKQNVLKYGLKRNFIVDSSKKTDILRGHRNISIKPDTILKAYKGNVLVVLFLFVLYSHSTCLKTKEVSN